MSREEPLGGEPASEVAMSAAHYELLREITTATITTMLLNETTKARYEAAKNKR